MDEGSQQTPGANLPRMDMMPEPHEPHHFVRVSISRAISREPSVHQGTPRKQREDASIGGREESTSQGGTLHLSRSTHRHRLPTPFPLPDGSTPHSVHPLQWSPSRQLLEELIQAEVKAAALPNSNGAISQVCRTSRSLRWMEVALQPQDVTVSGAAAARKAGKAESRYGQDMHGRQLPVPSSCDGAVR